MAERKRCGLAMLFPGQGAQRPGMGDSLRESDPELFRAHIERAEGASRLPIGRLAAEGPDRALIRTDVAQPALFAVCLALFDVACELGLRPVAIGGHSLGEYTAAAAAGAMTVDAGAGLVAARGRLMAAAQQDRPGAMAAIMGLAPEEIEAVCGEVAEDEVLEPANFNTLTQTVVSGDEAAVERLVRLLDRRRMTRATRLAAGAAFHSSLMAPVRDEFAALTAEIEWRDPVIPIVSNASGTLVRSASAVRSSLLAQLTSPVRWVQCVHALIDEGCEHFLELGPGTILRSLVRQISRKIDVVAVDSRGSIEDYIAARPYLVER